MSERKEFVVYLSSTLADLGAERDVAIKAIAESGVVKTSFRASEDGVVATCTDDVRNAHLYVGILGLRYGYQPPEHENNPEHKSITELEYEACQTQGQPAIPRLMFVKSTEAGIPKGFIDALSNKATAQLMDDFLARAKLDQVAYEFVDLNDLKAEIRIRVKDKATEYHKQNATTEPILTGSKPWSEQLTPVAIACVPGTDNNQLEKIKQLAGNRYKAFELSPDDANYLAGLDQGIRTAQVGALLLTSASLSRYSSGLAAEKFRAGLDLLNARTGQAVILCEGLSKSQLPADWADALILEFQTGDFDVRTEITLEQLFVKLRENIPTLSTEPRLALPYMIIAPTQVEADSLVDAAGVLFGQFADEDERDRRRRELERISRFMRQTNNEWPKDLYGAQHRRRNWQCFSQNPKNAETLIENVVERINNAPAGSREQTILRSARIVPRPYEFDEYLNNRFGSRAMIESLRDRGCLIVIDELALLHPALRKAADVLLTGSKTAVVSISTCDPAYATTGTLLSDFSFLRVGTMIQRFKIDHDPRCELILNSIERVERWLRFAIPELIASNEESKSNPQLVAKAHHLFN